MAGVDPGVKRLAAVLAAVLLLAGLGILGKYVLWPERPSPDAAGKMDVELSMEGGTAESSGASVPPEPTTPMPERN